MAAFVKTAGLLFSGLGLSSLGSVAGLLSSNSPVQVLPEVDVDVEGVEEEVFLEESLVLEEPTLAASPEIVEEDVVQEESGEEKINLEEEENSKEKLASVEDKSSEGEKGIVGSLIGIFSDLFSPSGSESNEG